MVATAKQLVPSAWVYRHDGLTFEFTSLDAAIAYVRGFKSVSHASKLRSLYGERPIIKSCNLPKTDQCSCEHHPN
jgi:hypothetical protein